MDKTIIIALTAMFMLGVLAPLAFAEDAIVEEVVATDETPMLISAATDDATISDAESDLNVDEDVNGLALGMKKAKLWFIFNQEKKTQLELELAKIQLIKAKIAAKNNNTEAMEKALAAHEKLINDVEKRTEGIKKTEKNESKLTGLDRAIEVHNARINKLNELLANTNLTDEQRSKIEAQLAKTENVTAKLIGVQAKIYANIAEKAAELKSEADSKNMTVEELIRERKDARDSEETEDSADNEDSEDNSTA
ncbi:MAG: hypothetical protein AABX17_00695 [Nanoarchaeota archaeon]